MTYLILACLIFLFGMVVSFGFGMSLGIAIGHDLGIRNERRRERLRRKAEFRRGCD